MKITLYLLSQKGFEVLQALVVNNFQNMISEVIVGRDKNVDNDFANEIIAICLEKNIVFFERTNTFKINSEYSIAISWRWIIHENTSKLIVLHDSLLPKYRGFAPLVNMLINQEPYIGVSAIFAASEYDKGNVIAQASQKINYPIKIAEAINLISQNYIFIIKNIFETLKKEENLPSKIQDEFDATYSLWRDENDYFINWNNDSNTILNFINAVSSPYKGATSIINGVEKVRILDAEKVDDVKIENRDVGKVIFIENNCPIIVCGSGLLKLTTIINDISQDSILPLKKFRSRFANN
jgi:methionyl-tRNA formyltransferase